MTGAWFALPATGAGTRADAYQPDLHGHDVTGWSGIRDGDEFLVRIYADDATLDALSTDLTNPNTTGQILRPSPRPSSNHSR